MLRKVKNLGSALFLCKTGSVTLDKDLLTFWVLISLPVKWESNTYLQTPIDVENQITVRKGALKAQHPVQM